MTAVGALRLGVFLVLAAAVPLIQQALDGLRGEHAEQRSVLYLRTGESLRRVVPGFEDLAADVYWLRTVQYYGGQRAFAKEKTFALLRPLIDITTSLDPRFELAYRYGAIFMSEPNPLGAGKPEEGIEILQGGIRALPKSWRLRFDLGSAYYFFLRDPIKAAAALREGGRLPGAPFWLDALAGRFLIGVDRNAAREVWKYQAQLSDGFMRQNATHHLELLDSLDRRDAARDLVKGFERDRGALPASLSDLVKAGYARSLPQDLSGRAFAYDPRSGAVEIAYGSPYWRASYE